MSDGEQPQLLILLKKSQAFAERLLKDNEELQLRCAATEERLHSAEGERDRLRGRMDHISTETRRDSAQFQELDEELNALANLHVATWQLHSTMSLREVAGIVVEICVNLIGADQLVVYLHDENSQRLIPVVERRDDAAAEVPLDDRPIGAAIKSGTVKVQGAGAWRVVIPLTISTRVLGAVVIETFLPQKGEVTKLDRQLFDMIAELGSTALYGAYLAGSANQRLSSDKIRAQFAEK